jgi:hypothetical protein
LAGENGGGTIRKNQERKKGNGSIWFCILYDYAAAAR